ncbi:hypothetical protein HPB52_024356 [Rhipicephalus sanguineus]|uniref:PEP-utilising enzyme mobile domain-containing protein n=1 Tax=Rhipicephalus sanguineus TaxID=34632 RepID=A0A9D4PC60_RHISA|nr:hypothetical protein HPB52_024356 [Rhipicephalus sanguineus]
MLVSTDIITRAHPSNAIFTRRREDVLVAYCTDIAWSPFFPLLSGVVTELGGLISHGAVVAREYGIPALSAPLAPLRPSEQVR